MDCLIFFSKRCIKPWTSSAVLLALHLKQPKSSSFILLLTQDLIHHCIKNSSISPLPFLPKPPTKTHFKMPSRASTHARSSGNQKSGSGHSGSRSHTSRYDKKEPINTGAYVWYCCHCQNYNNRATTPQCISCYHHQCSQCRS